MQNNVLYVWLIGKVKLQYNEAVLVDDKRQSKKFWLLLEFLIVNRNRFIPQQELLDSVWPDMDVRDPANSLKVLVFRVRKELDSLKPGLGAELILNKAGSYGFNSDFPCVIDLETVAQKYQQAKDCPETELSILMETLEMSSAGRPVAGIDEHWAEAIRARHDGMYAEMFRRCTSLLRERQDYPSIVAICEQDLLIHPEDETAYYYAIKALLAQERYVEARRMFQRARKTVLDQLDKPLDQRIVDAYYKNVGRGYSRSVDIEAAQNELSERPSYHGALYCEYEQFMSIYRLYERLLLRHSNAKTALCLFTLQVPRPAKTRAVVNKHIRILGETLAFTLRGEDVFCRCSSRQFLVLFSFSNDSDGVVKASERIKRCFEENRGSVGFEVAYVYRNLHKAYGL